MQPPVRSGGAVRPRSLSVCITARGSFPMGKLPRLQLKPSIRDKCPKAPKEGNHSCHSERMREIPRIGISKLNGRSVIAPASIRKRDSELVGAVIDRPQAVQEPEGRSEESPAYQKTKPNGRSVIAPTNIHERDSEIVGAVIDRPQTVRKVEGRRFFTHIRSFKMTYTCQTVILNREAVKNLPRGWIGKQRMAGVRGGIQRLAICTKIC